MQLPRPATMAIHSSSSDTPMISISNEDIAADIIRLQGKEVIRLRKELENAQKLNTTAFDLLRSIDDHMSEMQNDFHQRYVQLSFLKETLVSLQHENAASSHTLENMRANLRSLCGLFSPEQPLSHPVPVAQDNVVDEHYKSPSIAGSNRDDFVLIDDLSTEASITNISNNESDVESSTKSIAQLCSTTESKPEEPLREDNLNNLKKCCAASDEAARLTLQLALVKEAVMAAILSNKGGRKQYLTIQLARLMDCDL